MFVGKSLTNIRVLHDFSRKQLADRIGLTEQSIWQYENGYMSPKLEVVNDLKKLFNVKASYFYNPDLLESGLSSNIQMESIAYRSETINSSSKYYSESVHLKFIDSFLHNIEKKISYPRNELLDIRNEVINYLRENSDLDRSLQIEYIAVLTRKRLGLDLNSNQNLLFLLEKAGAFIFEKEIGDTVDAYSLWSEEDRPYIMLGNVKKSAVRRNFDLAHELGHLLLHYKVEFTMQDGKSYRTLEAEAHNFASCFLLPKEEFIKDFLMISKKSNPKAYVELKRKWLVSIAAMELRAYKLNLIEYQQHRYFYMSLNKYKYKFVEPLDDEIPINRPTKIKSILQLLFEKNCISVDSLTEELKVNIDFLATITGIDKEFFLKFMNIEEKKFTTRHLNIKAN